MTFRGFDPRNLRQRPKWAGLAVRLADGTLVSFEMDGSISDIEVEISGDHDRDDDPFDPLRIARSRTRYTMSVRTGQFVMRHFSEWDPDRPPPRPGPAGELGAAPPAIGAPPAALEDGGPGEG